MKTKNPAQQVNLGRFRLAMAAAAGAGLAAIAYAALTPQIEQAPSLMRMASAHASTHRAVAAGLAVEAPASPLAVPELSVPPAAVASSGASDGPRECRLDAGIDTACTFN